MCYTKIDHCRLCGERKLELLVDLGLQKLGSRFPSPGEEVPSSPLYLSQCSNQNCQLIQLEHNVDGGELYLKGYGYRSGLNNSMMNHLEGLVREIESRIEIKEQDIILDIGSNDATTLKYYSKGKRLGIDPTGEQFRSFYPRDIRLIPDFFSRENYPLQEKAKVITTISMFYDLPDIKQFVSDLVSVLHPDGIWVSEQSYCKTMIEKTAFDTICHEHLEYYNIKQFQYIASRFGLKIVDISLNSCNGGSFRITLAHQNNSNIPINTENIQRLTQLENSELNSDSFSDFIGRILKEKDNLTKFIQEEKSKGKKFCIYGASTKGNTLLQTFGLDSSLIDCAAERNPEKYGRMTPGANIPIQSEEFVRNLKPDYMLVLPWHFKEEFVKREEKYLNSGGKLIFPLPYFEIVFSEKKIN